MTAKLAGRTALITGASRGIGRAMALRFAKEGANIVLAAKTSDPHPKLPGTIHSVAEEVKALGGKALAVQCDVRFEESVQAAVDAAVKEFGGIDILVNNAGAIHIAPIEFTPVKKIDLMLGINNRAVAVVTHLALQHLKASAKAGHHPHVLNLSPPIRLEPKWLNGTSAYSMTKFGMTLLTMGFAEELREDKIAVNSLWPRTMIQTAAVDMLVGKEDSEGHSRKPSIMADAACEIVSTPDLKVTGRALLDEEILRERGVTDFEGYAAVAGNKDIWADFYVDGYGEGPLPAWAPLRK
ncbi:MAG: NAD(P)-dependent oxidoreductase [Deltaproteobacteria bacterium]|nr:NAD(P)-dependent oxidoreductase [Deltaproteobacteria bacterium]